MSERSKVDGLTDEERAARALALDEIAEKIKNEYGDALAVLGCMPVIQRIQDYSVADHVAHALSLGVVLNPRAQELQRDWLDALRGASATELALVTRILSAILEVHDQGMHHRGVLEELICVLTHTETRLESRARQHRRAERYRKYDEVERESE